MKIDKSVVEVLKTSEIDGSLLRLPGQLERKLYERVAKVLKSIGGKWSSAKKAFVFKEDVGDLVTSIADTGEFTPERQTFQFFPTPETLAREIVKVADIRAGERTLEPSAGQGNIAQFMPTPDCIELDPKNRAVLIERRDRRGVSPGMAPKMGNHRRIHVQWDGGRRLRRKAYQCILHGGEDGNRKSQAADRPRSRARPYRRHGMVLVCTDAAGTRVHLL